jgi:hypothetical protein
MIDSEWIPKEKGYSLYIRKLIAPLKGSRLLAIGTRLAALTNQVLLSSVLRMRSALAPRATPSSSSSALLYV